MSAITIGSAVSDRTGSGWMAQTILESTPASGTGTITSISIWAHDNMTGLRVGTFYHTTGSNYKCRASASIGAVVAGAKRDFAVSIAVVAGDLIGFYFDTGSIERTEGGGGADERRYANDTGYAIDPGDEVTYNTMTGYVCSLGGIGATPGGPAPGSMAAVMGALGVL